MAHPALRTFGVCVCLPVLAGAAGVVFCAEAAWAQRPKLNPNDIRKIVVAPDELTPEETDILNEYFNGFVFKLFKAPVRPDDLPNLRNRIYGVVVADAPKTAAHDHLNRMTLAEMGSILSPRGKYAAPVKYNAMLLIANLNESDQRGNIKPLPAAFPILLAAFGLTRPEMDYYKPAALLGLARWAEEGAIPPDKTAEVSEKLLALLNEKDPPPGRSASAHNYLRRGAAKVLATLGSTGPDDSVLAAFEAIAADPSARPLMRCEMARFIGELKISPDSKVDLRQLANILGHQTVEVCRQELDRAELAKRPASRRLIMYALDSSSVALQKLSTATERGTPARDFIYPLKSKLDSLYGTIGDPDETRDDDVKTVVAAQIVDIEGMLLDKQVAKAPPAAVVPAAVVPAAVVPAGPKPVPVRPASTK